MEENFFIKYFEYSALSRQFVMKITFDFCLLQRFAYNKHLQVIFSTEKQEFEKRTQMHVNLECSARKYKSARASNFGKFRGY